jgi:hypothetical protein
LTVYSTPHTLSPARRRIAIAFTPHTLAGVGNTDAYGLRHRSQPRPFLPEVILYRRGMGERGMGDATSQAVATGAGVAESGIGIAVAVGAIGGPVGALIGAGIGLVSMAITSLLNTGCGQTCVVTSQWANQAEPLLQQNIDAYFRIPAPRPRAAQVAGLANFDAIWQGLAQRCGQPGLGGAGERCISDRQAGSCKWHTQADSPYPGGPKAGGCFNWFNSYRDPIANDPQVADTLASDTAGSVMASSGSDPTSVVNTVATTFTAGGMSGSNLLLLGGGLLLLLGAVGGD